MMVSPRSTSLLTWLENFPTPAGPTPHQLRGDSLMQTKRGEVTETNNGKGPDSTPGPNPVSVRREPHRTSASVDSLETESWLAKPRLRGLAIRPRLACRGRRRASVGSPGLPNCGERSDRNGGAISSKIGRRGRWRPCLARKRVGLRAHVARLRRFQPIHRGAHYEWRQPPGSPTISRAEDVLY